MTHQTIEGPRMLGRYKLLDQLAVGGMAVVHLAIEQGDHALDRPVVIKQLQPDLDDESSQRMLLQEARLAARINHPNVVKFMKWARIMGVHLSPWNTFQVFKSESCWSPRKRRSDPVQSA